MQLGLSWWLRQSRICLQCRRPGFHPWIGKVPWRRGHPLQYSCLENSMDRGAWGAAAPGSQKVGHDWATNTFCAADPISQWIQPSIISASSTPILPAGNLASSPCGFIQNNGLWISFTSVHCQDVYYQPCLIIYDPPFNWLTILCKYIYFRSEL